MRNLKLSVLCLFSAIIRCQASEKVTPIELKAPPSTKGNRFPQAPTCCESMWAGIPGLQGLPGRPGFIGLKGEMGSPGLDGIPGSRGDKGDPGFPGHKGDIGDLLITVKDKNNRTTVAVQELQGEKGEPGGAGYPGISGLLGLTGLPGAPGLPGSPGKIVKSGVLLVRHSQTIDIPKCPKGLFKMWEGYSFLYYARENEEINSQDLGFSGSCMRLFSSAFLLECDIKGKAKCQYASHNAKSYWLSTNISVSSLSADEEAIRPYISRCVVCEAPSNIVAVHSQSVDVPDCPEGWNGLWTGYSFVMNTGAGTEGQSLTSPGSCLEDFQPISFIECSGITGTCDSYESKQSYWLATVDPHETFVKPAADTIQGEDFPSRVSRCQVCIKSINEE